MTREQLEGLFGDISVVQLALWIIAAIALIVLIVKAWPWIRRAIQTMDALAVLPDKLHKLDEVHHEVLPNHGGSLRDSADRTESKVDQLDKKFERHLEWSNKQRDRIDDALDRLGELERTLNPRKDS